MDGESRDFGRQLIFIGVLGWTAILICHSVSMCTCIPPTTGDSAEIKNETSTWGPRGCLVIEGFDLSTITAAQSRSTPVGSVYIGINLLALYLPRSIPTAYLPTYVPSFLSASAIDD